MTFKSKKFGFGKLTIKADFSQASCPIRFSIDDEEFDVTPFQVADARHDAATALKLVAGWVN